MRFATLSNNPLLLWLLRTGQRLGTRKPRDGPHVNATAEFQFHGRHDLERSAAAGLSLLTVPLPIDDRREENSKGVKYPF